MEFGVQFFPDVRPQEKSSAAYFSDTLALASSEQGRDPRVLDNAPIAVLLAILPANFAAQEHDGRRLSAHWRP
jgi:hypothetical protein